MQNKTFLAFAPTACEISGNVFVRFVLFPIALCMRLLLRFLLLPLMVVLPLQLVLPLHAKLVLVVFLFFVCHPQR